MSLNLASGSDGDGDRGDPSVAGQVLPTQLAASAVSEQSVSAARALRHAGLVHWQAQNLTSAAESFVSALQSTPDDPYLWGDLAAVHNALGNVDVAEFCIRESIGRDANRSASWLLLGRILAKKDEQPQAADAYRRTIALDPRSGDAYFGLGLVCFGLRRFDEAVVNLRSAVENGYANGIGHMSLGHALFGIGDFAGCAAAFEAAERFGALSQSTRRTFARARTFQAMIDGGVEDAIRGYSGLAGPDAEDIEIITRDAFSLLSAHGYLAAAVEIGRLRVASNPVDPIRRYLLDAVGGRPLTKAPSDYLERYFDLFAPEFDKKLVDILGYRVPEQLHGLVARHRTNFDQVLDIGCGTGLAARSLSELGGFLTGVDLSGRMLDEAARHGLYDELIKAEALSHLQSRPRRYDLIFGADILIYIGKLDRLMAAAAESLQPGGLFAFSIETTHNRDVALLPSGRFAHAFAYIERLARPSLEIIDIADTILRQEANRAVDGRLIVMRRT